MQNEIKSEIEAIFINIDKDAVRSRLKKIGANLIKKERLQKRINYDFNDKSLARKQGWVRLRDEGENIRLSYKQMDERSIDGMKEVSITVGDFENADLFLNNIGLNKKSYQETLRESWVFSGVEIDIDTWPWINPFIEIEGESEEEVNLVAEKLGFNIEDATFGSVNNLGLDNFNPSNNSKDFSLTHLIITDTYHLVYG